MSHRLCVTADYTGHCTEAYAKEYEDACIADGIRTHVRLSTGQPLLLYGGP